MEFCHHDFETRSLADVTSVGAYKYARHPSTEVLILAYAFNDEPVNVWSPPWAWPHSDQSLERLFDHVTDGGYMVAWNAAFERHIWNQVMCRLYNAPPLPIEQMLCAQAQAEASNLPGKLEHAAKCLRTEHKKQAFGKQLINQLCTGDRASWDSAAFSTSEKMGKFRAYGVGDVESERDLWHSTRPLTEAEWREYWASERINDRGCAVDAEFAHRAAQLLQAETVDLNDQLYDLTGDRQLTVTNHVRKARWLHDKLAGDEELQAVTYKGEHEKDDGSTVARYTCDRSTRELVLDAIQQPAHADMLGDDTVAEITEFLELVEAGNSAAARKFAAIHNYAIAGRVHGQYSFNGAGQTGRYSSRGVQIHNLIRDPVEKDNPDRAIDAVDDIMAGASAAQLVDAYGFPVSRLLARLLRPTFMAADGKTLVWGDFSQIEARVLPWLAFSDGADAKLALFRKGLDVYKYAASPIFGVKPDKIDDAQRQVGKVAELALGFGGAVGAFRAMGRGYGVHVETGTARAIVDAWRAANAWCVAYWHELWDAAMAAYNDPGTWYRAGRVHYAFHPMMYGTLVCQLPDGRMLVYPQFRHESYDDEGKTRWRTTYMKGIGQGARWELWYGVLAENVTQATAASFLRRALVELDDIAVLHTHDEIVCECDTSAIQLVAEDLRDTMLDLPEWAPDIPLEVDISHGPFYTK